MLVDLLLTVAGNYFAFWLRFDGAIPAPFWELWRETIPLLVLLRGLSFVPSPSTSSGGTWAPGPRAIVPA